MPKNVMHVEGWTTFSGLMGVLNDYHESSITCLIFLLFISNVLLALIKTLNSHCDRDYHQFTSNSNYINYCTCTNFQET